MGRGVSTAVKELKPILIPHDNGLPAVAVPNDPGVVGQPTGNDLIKMDDGAPVQGETDNLGSQGPVTFPSAIVGAVGVVVLVLALVVVVVVVVHVNGNGVSVDWSQISLSGNSQPQWRLNKSGLGAEGRVHRGGVWIASRSVHTYT